MYQYVSLFQMFESRIFVGFYTKLHLVLRALQRCTVAPLHRSGGHSRGRDLAHRQAIGDGASPGKFPGSRLLTSWMLMESISGCQWMLMESE